MSSKEEHTTETDESAIAALAITGRKVNPLIEKRKERKEEKEKETPKEDHQLSRGKNESHLKAK